MVGDDRQAIYGFSGADAEALPNMVRYFGATVCPVVATSGVSSSQAKSQQEAVIRALVESANTRTWNFLIDVIAQRGLRTVTLKDVFQV